MPLDYPPVSIFDAMLATQRTYLDFWTRAFGATTRELVPQSRDLVPYSNVQPQDQQTISVGEEWLDVSTRQVFGPTTRVRRVVHTSPVERRVDLRDETIIVERRQANGETGDDALSERDYVMSDTYEVPVVNKRTRLREVVILRKEIRNRSQVIRDSGRHADVQVEQPQRVPVMVMENNRHHQGTVPADRKAQGQEGAYQGHDTFRQGQEAFRQGQEEAQARETQQSAEEARSD